jgi:hypothetical protein
LIVVPNAQEASPKETLKRLTSRFFRPNNKRPRGEEGAALPSSCRCSDPGKNEEHTMAGSGTINAKIGSETPIEKGYTENGLRVTKKTKYEVESGKAKVSTVMLGTRPALHPQELVLHTEDLTTLEH